jgi:type IV pilus assembly protein PilA
MITVLIVGVLAALATYGVRRYVGLAKSTEATNAVGRMARDAVTAYERENMASKMLKSGKSVAASKQLCSSASRTVPQNASKVKGKKYQSNPAEWERDASKSSKGFACLKFSMTGPQYFLYRYKTNSTNATKLAKAGATFDAIAEGDLDGDGERSEIKMAAKIRSTASGAPELFLAPSIRETSPEE